jgi:hypothetical protein
MLSGQPCIVSAAAAVPRNREFLRRALEALSGTPPSDRNQPADRLMRAAASIARIPWPARPAVEGIAAGGRRVPMDFAVKMRSAGSGAPRSVGPCALKRTESPESQENAKERFPRNQLRTLETTDEFGFPQFRPLEKHPA